MVITMIFDRNISIKKMFRETPFTTVMIILNLLMFILDLILPLFGYDLFSMGAIEKYRVLELNQYYRILTAAFIHSGLVHLLSNVVFGLFLLTSGFEKIVGTFKTAFIYLSTLVLSGLIVVYFTPVGTGTVGASGAIFGVLGALLFLTFFRKDLIQQRDAQAIRSLIIMNVLVTIMIPGISIAGHFGGLVVGFILSFLIVPRDKSEYEIYH
jgi:rhomboid protease GluP